MRNKINCVKYYGTEGVFFWLLDSNLKTCYCSIIALIIYTCKRTLIIGFLVG